MEQGKDGEEDMEGKFKCEQSSVCKGGGEGEEGADTTTTSPVCPDAQPTSTNRERSPLPPMEEKTEGQVVDDRLSNKESSLSSEVSDFNSDQIVQNSKGEITETNTHVNSEHKDVKVRQGSDDTSDVSDRTQKSDVGTIKESQTTNDDTLGAKKSNISEDDKGTEGGDEEEDDTKRLKQKRRLGSAGSLSAPAPKIKRMRKSLGANADSKKDSKKDKKDDVYQRQVQKQKEREKAAQDESEDKDKRSESKSRKKETSDEDGSSDESDPLKKKLKQRGGLSAMPKVKNLRRNIRDIMSDDKLEEGTLNAQKEEKLRLQRLQEKRAAMMEYMEQQQVERLVAEVSADLEAVAEVEAAAEAQEESSEEQLPIEIKKEPEVEEEARVLEDEEEGDNNNIALTKVSESEEEVIVRDSDIVVLSSEEEEEPETVEEEEETLFDEDHDKIKIEQHSEEGSGDEILEHKIKVEKTDEGEKLDTSAKEEEVVSDADSDIMILSEHSSDDEEIDDVNNSGAHINDEFNVPDAQGRVLVNVGHPENEEDIFLAPQLANVVKPHQVGGIRFLYDNIIESIEQYKTSNGFGCILAHSMGLGKTLQIVSFTDILLSNTDAKSVLIIVPINTIQNWQAEFNNWLPENVPEGLPEEILIKPRKFKVFLINDGQKNLQARAKIINEWYKTGGVLLMGYELYRQLAMKKPKKPKKKKKKGEDNQEVVDIEEEDKNKEILEELQEALVKPGPDLIICDEGHRIKNAHANISQALKNIRTKRRVVLTGYPLQNNLMEYWCMVDFVRPNYLGTKTEFSNMFERPIQNGQCVDSTPQDKKLMRYRAHVLHSLLEGFVQRRGHTVLRKSLPDKHEHVLLCRMTPIQRKLYSTFMAELSNNKAVSNPLKAFAVCCKIWNHPDVLYNFLMKRMNEDFDLDLDEVVGKANAKGRRGIHPNAPAANSLNPLTPVSGASPWTPQLPTSRGLSTPHSQTQPLNMSMNPIGMHGNSLSHQPPSSIAPQMMHPSIPVNRDTPSHPGMPGYNMGSYNLQQPGSYAMQQLPQYPWYNQGYSNNPNDPASQHYPNYNNPYSNMQYPQQQLQQQQQQLQLQQMQQQQQQQSQQLPATQSIPGYPPILPGMHSTSMGVNPLNLNVSASHPSQIHDQNTQNLHQDSRGIHDQNNHNIQSQTGQSGQGVVQNTSGLHQNNLSMGGLLSNGSNMTSSLHGQNEGLQHSPENMNAALHHSTNLQHNMQSGSQGDRIQQVLSHNNEVLSHGLNHTNTTLPQELQQQNPNHMSQRLQVSDSVSQNQSVSDSINRGIGMSNCIGQNRNPLSQQMSSNNSPQGLLSQGMQENTDNMQQMSLQNNQQNGQILDQQNCDTMSQEGQMTPGHMTPGHMTPGPMTPGSMSGPLTPGQLTPSPQTPGSFTSSSQPQATQSQSNPGQSVIGQHLSNQINQEPQLSHLMSGGQMVQNQSNQGHISGQGMAGSLSEQRSFNQEGGFNPHQMDLAHNNGTTKTEVDDKETKPKLESEEKGEGNKSDPDKKIKDEDIKKEKIDEEEEKKEEKKEEITFEWAEPIFKDYIPGLLENSAKFQIVFRILEGSLGIGDRLLIFSQSLFTLSLLEEFLQRAYIPGTYEGWARNRSYFRLDGSTSAQDREKLINEFNSNPNIRLFLVSTRAGSLGINLAGANRVVVFDASFNPCHDTQAVCRVYRYGQQKQSYIYRLVSDYSLEKRIYDRQINKQGISDRILDEMNPDAHLSSKEISNLMVEAEDEDKEEDFTEKAEDFTDDLILKEIVSSYSKLLTKLPFKHESLLVDRKDKKLSQAEKRLAKRSYELEKQANISYSRPSYAAFYPKGQGVMMGTKIGGIVYTKNMGGIRHMQHDSKLEPGMIHRPNILSRGSANFPVEALAKQGVSVQQITVPKAVSIPTNTGDGKPIQLQAGQSVMVIKTQKGMYLRLSDGKIVAIRVPPGSENFGLPLNTGSVTIVPTVSGNPRPRTPMIRGQSRRGRPPMSAQYALGHVVPKGVQKGQMAVRIMRKQVMGGRGGKSYQTIAVPVSSNTPHALLNKSVVITPANRGSAAKMGRKISPKGIMNPIGGKHSGVSVSLIPSTSGIKGQKIQTSSTNILTTAKELARKAKPTSSKNANSKSSKDGDDAKSKTGGESDSGADSNDENDEDSTMKDESGGEGGNSQDKNDAELNEAQAMDEDNNTNSSKENEAHSTEEKEELMSSNISGSTTENFDKASSSANISSVNQANLNELSSGLDLRDQNKSLMQNNSSTSESMSDLVKPQGPPMKESALTPLQSMSNLVPPGSSNISNTQSQNFITSSELSGTTYSATASQPLFQPFLQRPLSTIANTTTSSTTSNELPSNVSSVAQQVQSSTGNLTQSSYLSSSLPHFSVQGMSTLTTSAPQTTLPSFSTTSDSSNTTTTSLPSISHITGTQSATTRAEGVASGDSPLSLSNLLGTQAFDQNADTAPPAHPSSALDYLNYSLTAGSSAFRRPEFPSPLASDLQSLLTSSSNQLPTGTLPTPPPAHSNSSPSVTSGSFTPQSSAYSQYAAAYRPHSAAPGFRTPPSMTPGAYSSIPQYPYPSQYTGLTPHAVTTPQPPTMGQYGTLQSTANPYQTYPATASGLPPYSPGLSGFGHGPYPPM